MAAPSSTFNVALRPAVPADVTALFSLVNEAYKVESGDKGLGFKRTLRFDELEECSKPVAEERVIVAVATTADEKIVGTVFYQLQPEASTIAFGPFAVDPAFQGHGIGRKLISEVERLGTENKLQIIQLEIVNHRSDLVPIYRHLGFVPVCEEPFVPAHAWRLTRPSHFVVFRRLVVAPPKEEWKTMANILRLLQIPTQPSGTVRLRMGERKDLPSAIALVNEAYEVEEGNTGVAFKKAGEKRLMRPAEQTEPWVNGTSKVNFVVAEDAASGELLGVIVADLSSPDNSTPDSPASNASGGKKLEPAVLKALESGKSCVHFGPFAVAKGAQGKGVGSKLLDAVEAYAMANKASVDIEVVSTRSDVRPLYEKRGYKEVGTMPWKEWELDIIQRPVHFVLMRKEDACEWC